MFKIYNGGEYFYQWDLGQRLVMDEPFTKVHYCNRTGDCALVCETYEENGQRLVHVPNILLQDTANIRVYGVYEEGEEVCYSKCMQIFRVISRGKPDSYVYTEDEVMSWTVLEARVNEGLENTGYYVPTVDAEGNLSWSASKESLPATETVNIKGEKGDKGDTGEVSLAYADQTYTSFDYANSTFANVLKGNTSGNIVTLTDASPVEHTINIKVKSKNIANNPVYRDVPKGDANGGVVGSYIATTLEKGKTYTMSFDTENTGAQLQFVVYGKPLKVVSSQYPTADGTRKNIVFTMTEDYYKSFSITWIQLRSASTANSGLCSNFMIEEGATATAYTEYVADIAGRAIEIHALNDSGNEDIVEEPTLDENGACSVTSRYPYTSIWAMNDGLVVNVEYNRDINKAFAELEEKLTQAIISLGNNI